MKTKLKALLFGAAVVIGLSLWNPINAADFATNTNWCTINSGAINVSHQECVGLVHLYNETAGDNWITTGNWFSHTDLSTWSGGIYGSTGAIKIAGGHIVKIDLQNNRMSGYVMTGLIYLPYLTALELNLNGLTGINLSQNTGLTFLYLGSRDLRSIDLTMLTGLKILSIQGGFFTGINLSQNINLTGLVINNTNITYVDTSRSTGLISLGLSLNALTGLDVSSNPSLTYLEAAYQSGKNMSNVNLSGANYIYRAWLSDAGIQNINLINVVGLSSVQLDDNRLTSISFTGNNQIGNINIAGNNISRVDFSNNPLLYDVYLDRNTGLNYIDISQNTGQLHRLTMSGNNVTGFAISTTSGYPSNLTVDFFGNTFVDSSLTLDQLWFLNKYFPGWGYRGIPGPGSNPYASSGGGGGGGGGGSSAPQPKIQTGTITTGTIMTGTINTGTIVPPVITPVVMTDKNIYDWAFAHNITTLPIAKARLNDGILRYEAAKMIVNFAVKVNGTTIAHNPTCNVEKYTDATSYDSEMKQYITNICDLGLMGWKGDKKNILEKFRPFDTLSAEEFGIVIGRYLGESENNPQSSKRVDIMRFLFNANK